jgi:PAS domain S-box-containing protein
MGRVFRSGRAELVQEVGADPDYLAAMEGIVSEIAVPLLDKGKPVGVLNVESTNSVMLTQADLRVMKAVGEEVSIALTKARLYTEANANAKRYSDLVATLGEGIAILDINEHFLFANPAAEAVFGVLPGKLVGRNLAEFQSPTDFAFVVSQTEKRKRGESGSYETVIRRLDGDTRQIEVVATPYRDDDGQIKGSLAVFRDITNLRRAEQERMKLREQLAQAQKMELVGRLAGGIAHDFNNLLQVIVGYTETAMESLTPDVRPFKELQQIMDTAHRSANLIRQLLTFARKQDVVPQVVDLNETVSRALKMLRRLIGEDIQLIWKPGPDLWPVKIDPAQVDQVLANLAANARDAIAGVGSLTVTTSNMLLDESAHPTHPEWIPGEYVQLSVGDTGVGISAETREHIFEPFFTTKGTGQGTGLGLATVYGIVEQNNGFIDVQSVPGSGATFNLYFPRAKKIIANVSDETEYVPPSGDETVLIVEDEGSILKLAGNMLQRLGYVVMSARSPGEAIALVEKHDGPLQLLLTDVVMPEMNGPELYARLSAVRAGIKALFMSGYTADAVSQRGAIAEGMQFIQKPFSIRTLAYKVREVLDQT